MKRAEAEGKWPHSGPVSRRYAIQIGGLSLAALLSPHGTASVRAFAGTSAAGLPNGAAKSDTAIRFEFGADYYPENWPPERVEVDARLMQQAKFTTVRMVDTNWQHVEPADGVYDFAWLDRVLEILNRHGIRPILCTPTYAPPAWMMAKHSDFYLVDEAGTRYRWGGLGHVCLNNPGFLQYVEKIVTVLATRYGHHQGVIGWQIHNEVGAYGYGCYDKEYCLPKFRQYLQKKFGTLDELNKRLLTVAYGHTYSSWDEIPLQWHPAGGGSSDHDAPLLLEAPRFFSQVGQEFLTFQASILRKYTSGQFITHNLPTPFSEADAFDLAKPVDFLCDDSYPQVGEYASPAFALEAVRGVNHGKPYYMLEQRSRASADSGVTLRDAVCPPGLARLWGWQDIAHGANGVVYWRWRFANGGSEQYLQGILNFDGSPGPAFPEVVRFGDELARFGPAMARTENPSSVAHIISYDSRWALHVGNATFPYMEQLVAISHGFRRWALNVDFVEPMADLSKYKVVVAPTLHVIDPAIVENLDKFVSQGGVLVFTPRSGFKTKDNLATQVPPGPLTSIAKVRVVDYTLVGKVLNPQTAPNWFGFPGEPGAYRPVEENSISSVSPRWSGEYKIQGWADVLEPDGAEVLFRYSKDFYSGRPAVTLAEYGKGRVIYVGTLLEPRFYFDFARRLCDWANVPCGPQIPEGMDYGLRKDDRQSYHFLLNFSDNAKSVTMPGKFRDILSNKVFDESVTVPPVDLSILVRS